MIRAIVLLALWLAGPASAECRTAETGAGCVTVPGVRLGPPELRPPPVEIGARLPRGRYDIVHETEWYGLPRATGTWVYMRIEDDLYRVDWRTMEVLERVTQAMRRPWPEPQAEPQTGTEPAS